MNLLDGRIYRVGEIEIDPARNCLRRGDQEQTLRQKSFQVLVYLLEHRERLVTKEELIKQVWDGLAVTDDAVVQIIVDIRRALGDDSRHPRLIRTIPKAGYHFISPVEIISPAPSTIVPSAMAATAATTTTSTMTAAATVEIEEVTSVQVEIEKNTETGRSLRRGALAATFGLSLVLTVAFTVRWAQRWDRPPAVEITLPRVPGKKPVAVMYFENQSSDRDLDWLREGMADMLVTNLSRSKTLTVLSRQQLHLLLKRVGREDVERLRLDEAQEIARRARAEVVVMGSFARLGEKTRIDAALHDVGAGHLLAAESLIADKPEQILTQIDLLSFKLASRLGAAMIESEPNPHLAEAMTNNLDAYRYYSLAMEQTQMFQFHEAIALLEKALALDPQFAMAHARIGYVYAVRMGQGDKAGPHLGKALALADQLSEKDKLFITAWQANAAHDTARAIDVYHDLTARYPMETEAYQRLSVLLQTQNRNEEALTVIRRGLLTDPEWKDLYNQLGGVCMRLGRNDEALAAFQRYIQFAPNDPNAWDSLGLFRQWLGKYEEAEAAYNRALALNPESGVAIIHLANLRFQQGRYRAAGDQFRRFNQIARDDNQRARGFSCLAWVHLKQGDLTRAVAAAKEEVKYNPASLWNSLALALARRDQAAVAKLSDAVFAPSVYNAQKERGFLRIWEYMRGYVALRQGRPEDALNHFREALRHRAVEWNIDSFEDCLANAYLELGRWDEAIAEYERILSVNPNYPLAQYHLARAYEGNGDRDRARAAYRGFLQIWKDADADVPEVIEAKRRA